SREYDWDGRSHLLCCRDSGPNCEDDIHLETDELGCDFAIALVASLRPAILDSDGSALDPAKFTQPLHESRGPRIPVQRRARPQKADGWQLRLLRPRRERPRCRCAAEQRDELAALHRCDHSITSSARASSVGGTSRPSALAALRLIANSNLVGCTTGRSAGRAPLSTLPT